MRVVMHSLVAVSITYQKIEDCREIFRSLQRVFDANLTSSLSSENEQLTRLELKARSIATVGRILAEKSQGTQNEIARIYDEVFADCTCSTYLAAAGLDKPAEMILRRVLELGIAAVYLWDMPHVYWGWKRHDRDLNFDDMVGHLSSAPYQTYVAETNGSKNVTELFDAALARTTYRALSNTIHGKIATFETALKDRFKYAEEDWRAFLTRAESIAELVTTLAKARFKEVRENLPNFEPRLCGIK
jgi:hypothetical protein